MNVEYHNDAADKLDGYKDLDDDLLEAYDKAIDKLWEDSRELFLRSTFLRPPGSYVVEVFVPGRSTDDHYYFFWVEEPGNVAFIRAVATTKTKIV
ncbi:hypothetical protein BWO91_14330 [Plantibacter flavus]|uniref:hypothetical protein n=1 Tax=Plantibacter flavus TaxID=150123 RepID=UPI00099C677B|nr:hypothetical protein [Plantibacter flavus]AQX80985.1 hypothetical protein BWO91_14330 [Plantibacter flavus]